MNSSEMAMHIDEPSEESTSYAELKVSGWAFSSLASVVRVEALINDVFLGHLHYGLARPDVASHWSQPTATMSGFQGVVPLIGVDAGHHTLTVRIRDARDNVQESHRGINVIDSVKAKSSASSSSEHLSVKFAIDEPAAWKRSAGSLSVNGWAFSESSPIAAVQALIDDGDVVDIPYGLPRLDVEAVHAHSHAVNCGFSGVVDLHGYEPGNHVLKLLFIDNRGQTGQAMVDVTYDAYAAEKAFPDGHYYSPIVNCHDVEKHRDRLWPAKPVVLGIDFNERRQRDFLLQHFPPYIGDYDYPALPRETDPKFQFYADNPAFGALDSRVLFVMLRHVRPKRMIEVGAGFTSLLTADINRRFLANSLDFTCIDPYLSPVFRAGVPGIRLLIQEKVEDLPLSPFEDLSSGDVLFIDSSHVSKTGNDVNYLVFEVIPRLEPGVFIHIHDIFLPEDYPEQWVTEKGYSWNEQYVVRALLMYSDAFEITFGSAFVAQHFPDMVEEVIGPGCLNGGSLWLRKARK